MRNTKFLFYLLFPVIILLDKLQISASFEILYLQEPIQKYIITSTQNYSLSTYSSAWTSTNLYAASTWVKMENYTDLQAFMIFRITNVDKSIDDEGRVVLAASMPTNNSLFAIGGSNGTYWSPYFTNTIQNMFPIGAWYFICVALDQNANLQYGYTFRADNLEVVYKQMAPTGTIYPITPSTTVYWGGGDYEFPTCNCSMQYFRIYIDYIPASLDEFKNLAIMDLTSTLFIFHFTANNQVNLNQTFPADKYRLEKSPTPIQGQALGRALSNAGASPNFGPYNMLNCRSQNITSFPLTAPNSDGLVVAFDFKPYSGTSSIQPIMTVRSISMAQSMVKVDYIQSNSSILIWYYDSSAGAYAFVLGTASSQQIPLGVWSRIIIELVPLQPAEFGVGKYLGKIWVNGIPSADNIFGDIAAGKILFPSKTGTSLDFCGRVSDNTISGNYDMLNFLWFVGTEHLYSNTTDSTCLVTGFLNHTQQSCLQCQSGYYFLDKTCVDSCPSEYFIHEDTKSCQKCHYNASKYYTSDGFCTDCISDYVYPIGPVCSKCHSTCQKCFGGLLTECTLCPNSTYLQLNNTCMACETDRGYFIDDIKCSLCHPSCKTCFGPNATNCLTCHQSTRLYSCNNSCVIDRFYLEAPSLSAVNSATTAGSWIKSIAQFFALVLPLCTQAKGMLSMILMALLGELEIFKYLNVLFPANFLLFSRDSRSYLMSNPYSSVNVSELNTSYFCVGKYEEFHLSSIFLENGGSQFTFFLVFVMLILLWMIICRCLRNSKSLSQNIKQKIFAALSAATLSFFIANFKEVTLYVILQLKFCEPMPGYIESSFGLCFFILVLYGSLIGVLTFIANVKKSEPAANNVKQPKRISLMESSIHFNSISQCLAQNNFLCRNFVLVILLQDLFTVLILFFLQETGIVQTALYLTGAACMIIITGVLMPFVSGVELFAFGLWQGTKLVLGSLALLLGLNMQNGILDDTGFETIGEALTGLIITIAALVMLTAGGCIVLNIVRGLGKGKKSSRDVSLTNTKNKYRTKRRAKRSPNQSILMPDSHSPSRRHKNSNDRNQSLTAFNIYLNHEIALEDKDNDQRDYLPFSEQAKKSPLPAEKQIDINFNKTQESMFNRTEGSRFELTPEPKLSPSSRRKVEMKEKNRTRNVVVDVAFRRSVDETEFRGVKEKLVSPHDNPRYWPPNSSK